MNKYLVGTCAYNEGQKIQRVLTKLKDYKEFDVLVIDDGSNDGSLDATGKAEHVKVIRNAQKSGAGSCVRQILSYAKDKGYEAVLFISGNDKDDPEDLMKLKKALEDGFDFVQGSRYLPGGEYGNTPFYRIMATRWIHPKFFSFITSQKITDSTNGFRAVRISLLEDARINLDQEWLQQYELEPYLFFKAVKCGHKVTEVPVKKIYPPRKHGYTKMKPIVGWWSILRPLLYLWLGIKK